MPLFLIGFLTLAIPIWVVLALLRSFGFLRGINKNVFLIPIGVMLGGIALIFFQILGFFVVMYSMSVGQ